MPLSFVAGAHNEVGGLALSVSFAAPASIQVGDLILLQAQALENTRGWGAYINTTGKVGSCTDLFTDGASPGPGGALQYTLDNGVAQRLFWWAGWRIATGADTGSPTYTFNATASPAAGVGMAASCVVYRSIGSSNPVTSFASTLSGSTVAVTTVTCPSASTPAGGTGTYTFTVSTTNATRASGATFVVIGDVGDLTAICLPTGLGGTGTWNPPAGLTARLQAGGPGGPWYMNTWADGPTPNGGGTLGRLPLLGAG